MGPLCLRFRPLLSQCSSSLLSTAQFNSAWAIPASGSFYAISASCSLARQVTARVAHEKTDADGASLCAHDVYGGHLLGGLVERCHNMTVIAMSRDLIANLTRPAHLTSPSTIVPGVVTKLPTSMPTI